MVYLSHEARCSIRQQRWNCLPHVCTASRSREDKKKQHLTDWFKSEATAPSLEMFILGQFSGNNSLRTTQTAGSAKISAGWGTLRTAVRLFKFSFMVNNSHFHMWVLWKRHTYALSSVIYCGLLLFLGFFQWNMSLPAHCAANWPTLHI